VGDGYEGQDYGALIVRCVMHDGAVPATFWCARDAGLPVKSQTSVGAAVPTENDNKQPMCVHTTRSYHLFLCLMGSIQMRS
jgi:hypothetical protein